MVAWRLLTMTCTGKLIADTQVCYVHIYGHVNDLSLTESGEV